MPLTCACRRGVSLVELVVALALLGVVGGLVLRATALMGRHAAAVSDHAAAGGNVRTGMLLLQAEFRGLGGEPSGAADLVRIAPDSVTYRAIRGTGVTCAVAATQVRIRDAAPISFGGLRAIVPGRDSLLLFVDGDPDSPVDDRWIGVPVTSVGSATCAGTRALAVGTPDFTAALPSGDLAGVVPGGPVLTFEVMRLAEYLSGGQLWLGTASLSAGEVIQPVAGPLAGSGLTLEYLSEGGVSVVDPAAVRRVRATLIGGTARPVGVAWSGGPTAVAAETLVAEIFLRNTPR